MYYTNHFWDFEQIRLKMPFQHVYSCTMKISKKYDFLRNKCVHLKQANTIKGDRQKYDGKWYLCVSLHMEVKKKPNKLKDVWKKIHVKIWPSSYLPSKITLIKHWQTLWHPTRQKHLKMSFLPHCVCAGRGCDVYQLTWSTELCTKVLMVALPSRGTNPDIIVSSGSITAS